LKEKNKTTKPDSFESGFFMIIQIIWAPLSAFRSQSFHSTALRKKDFRSSRGALRKVETFPLPLEICKEKKKN